jgi:hypothetical protein
MEFKSQEEKYFSYYLDELKNAGFVSNYWYEPTSFVLSEKVKITVNEKSKTLFQEHSYTPDFKIQFNIVPEWLSSHPIINNIWWVDVKGTFNRHGGDRVFPINAKWMYQRHEIMVEKVIPQKLFEKTFTPEIYLLTDISKQKRKIKWQITTLKQKENLPKPKTTSKNKDHFTSEMENKT